MRPCDGLRHRVEEAVIAGAARRPRAVHLDGGPVHRAALRTFAPPAVGHAQTDGGGVGVLVEEGAALLDDDAENVRVRDAGPGSGGGGDDQALAALHGEVLGVGLPEFRHGNEGVDVVVEGVAPVSGVKPPGDFRLAPEAARGVESAEGAGKKGGGLDACAGGDEDALVARDD